MSKDPCKSPTATDGECILSILTRGNFVTPSVRRAVEMFAQRWEISSFHALLMTRAVSDSDLADALAKQLGIHRLFQIKSLVIDEESLRVIGFKRARSWECLVFTREDGGYDLVFADPTQHERVQQIKQELAERLDRKVTLAVSERSDVVAAIDELFPLAEQLPSLFHNEAR